MPLEIMIQLQEDGKKTLQMERLETSDRVPFDARVEEEEEWEKEGVLMMMDDDG